LKIEERVALLEGRVHEQAAFMTELRKVGAELRQDMRDLRQEMRDLRQDVERRFDAVDRRFAWLVGLVVTGFVTVIGTVASAFWGVLQVVR
jgi:uncharacterized coiled-coil protein SlyX